ncbi:MAG: dTDP-4-amino-4,6-dideoxygalactose transaminase [Bacteroidota bacterium]
MTIPFNKPYLTGNEIEFIQDAVSEGHLSGNGKYTKLCHQWFEAQYGFGKCLLTSSCTDALEMAAILLNIGEGDEVIMPSYTFVSTANAFVLRGAKIVFADSSAHNPNIDAAAIEPLISQRTKAIVVVHYAGVACDMDAIMQLANEHNLFVVEDAAQAIDSYYLRPCGERKALGSIGHLAAFSFHETKNITCGEGGMLVVNEMAFAERAEIIWEKGTNRSAFFRGEVGKYGWVDIGSSFLPSELAAAFLYGQLTNLEHIQEKRRLCWQAYSDALQPLQVAGLFSLAELPEYATNNAHMFYIICRDIHVRSTLIEYLKAKGILVVFHYLSLHKSPYYCNKHDGRELPHADFYCERVLRLPMFVNLNPQSVIAELVHCLESQ